MDILNIVLGLSCIFLSLAYIIYRFVLKSNEIQHPNFTIMPEQISINIAVFTILIVGLILIYRELKYYF